MNREQAINYLISSGFTHEQVGEVVRALTYESTGKNFTQADIDAIVKAINEGWELRVNEILGKIRAEIRANSFYVMPQYGRTIREADVLHIIDKYKADKEQKDDNN